MTVITGPSGSGKSSLAFDTIYAEGRRRFVESLTSYARQFVERLPRPDVEEIGLLPPAIGVQHTNAVTTARSTVGTASELLDLLRLLFARAGQTRCPDCRLPVQQDTVQSAADSVLGLPDHARVVVAATVKMPRSKEAREAVFAALRRQGYHRAYLDDHVVDLEGAVRKGTLEVVIDRLRPRLEERSRVGEALEAAMRLGAGHAVAHAEPGETLNFSSELTCSGCGRRFVEPTEKTFSFNSPIGACPECKGFGRVIDIDIEKVVPSPGKSLSQGAIAPWESRAYRRWRRKCLAWAGEQGIPTDRPFGELCEDHRRLILEGGRGFKGVRGFFRLLEAKKYKTHVRVFLSRYRGYYTCPQCGGARLKADAKHVFIGGKTLPELCDMSIRKAARFLGKLTIPGERGEGMSMLLEQIRERLGYLLDTGLGYVSLSRQTRSLSGGEYQRLALARALSSGLTGTLYVLDEPTVGLHARDTARMLGILDRLTAKGNTVVVVEHDPQVISSADYVVDLGPGAGRQGGEVLYEGPPQGLLAVDGSPTAAALRPAEAHGTPERRKPRGHLRIVGATEHNLRDVDVAIPLGVLCCLTGVSGSGKSTLMANVLYGNYNRIPSADRYGRGRCTRLEGLDLVSDIVMVDQEPLARSPRSIPATYLGAWDSVRKALAATPTAKAKGLKASDFSFNVSGGRCELCKGTGVEVLEMQFVADVTLVCEACGGKRFLPRVLEATYRGFDAHQILQLSATDALHHLAPLKEATRRLQVLTQLGLGYLQLGQPLSTLSAGEAQRLKLAHYLYRPGGGGVLFLLDEPTTGLHHTDITKLLRSFERLLHRGHSILAIEHNLQVVAASDYVIDMGPEGGDRGGRVVAQGTPEEVAREGKSHTSKVLRPYVL
jgi:excinuclease ABC subunit A